MAKQLIAHGRQIDAATPEEIAALIAQATSTQGVEEYRRIRGVIQLGGTGAGQTSSPDSVIDVPSDFDLLLERVAIGGAGAVNALVGLYENDVTSDLNLLEIIQLGTAGKYSDGFSNNIYVTANSAVHLTVVGGIANGQVTYNLQCKLRKHPS